MSNSAREPESIRCPNCAEWINVNAILCRHCQCGLSPVHFKPCHSCSEMVRKGATRCKYCQSDLLAETEQNFDKRTFEPRVIRSDDRFASNSSFSANMDLVRQRVNALLERIRRDMGDRLDEVGEDVQPALRQRIREIVNDDPAPLTMMEKGLLLQRLLDEVFGFGPLGPLLRDPSLRDIFVYGPNQVYVERGGDVEKEDIEFNDDDHIGEVIARLFRHEGAKFDGDSLANICTTENGTVVIAAVKTDKNHAMLIIRTPRP